MDATFVQVAALHAHAVMCLHTHSHVTAFQAEAPSCALISSRMWACQGAWTRIRKNETARGTAACAHASLCAHVYSCVLTCIYTYNFAAAHVRIHMYALLLDVLSQIFMYNNVHSLTRPWNREQTVLLAMTGLSARTPAPTCGKCMHRLNNTDMFKHSQQAQAKGSARQGKKAQAKGSA